MAKKRQNPQPKPQSTPKPRPTAIPDRGREGFQKGERTDPEPIRPPKR